MRYAESTSVPVERSKAEIERTLTRYGASQFMSGWDAGGKAILGFVLDGRMVQMNLQLPSIHDPKFHRTPTGRTRKRNDAAERAWEQECRSRWRALALVVKAKLEAVESGISTFETEFLAHIVLPDGKTVGGWIAPQLDAAYGSGKMPGKLPLLTEGRRS